MTTQVPSKPAPAGNRIGLAKSDYKGGESTLCGGCGHDAITSQIITAYFELGIQPHQVLKLSGIGCSSKTPAYFLNRAWGFNAVHGRMPSIATGANLANHQLRPIGVSGDGDTASIGIGQFVHMMRRNVRMVYLVENNGVYGLTKGQFSATADLGAKLKSGEINVLPGIDLCALAIELGCGFVARSFSGDPKQLLQILKAAISHKGMAMIDIISPCVTFNNHEGSTKSYTWAKAHEEPIHEIGFVPHFDPITAEIPSGETRDVPFPDGSHVRFRKIKVDFDPTSKIAAIELLHKTRTAGEILTGIFHLAPERPSLSELQNLVDQPLATLPESMTRPSRAVLKKIMEELT
jgi:2-oxoglutarate ferredoxin oxidoreductase subunit beta